jgi:hypothetical protein
MTTLGASMKQFLAREAQHVSIMLYTVVSRTEDYAVELIRGYDVLWTFLQIDTQEEEIFFDEKYKEKVTKEMLLYYILKHRVVKLYRRQDQEWFLRVTQHYKFASSVILPNQ